MRNLPYNPSIGNGIVNVNELYDYLYKYPLRIFDDSFMKSYSTMLAMSNVKTMVAYFECAQLSSGDMSEEEVCEKCTEFMNYLKTCEGYGLHDTGEDPSVYERITNNWIYSSRKREMSDTEQCHYYASQCGCEFD